MADPGDDRIAERVDAAAIAEKIDAERLIVALDRRPEALARQREALEHRIGQRPYPRPRLEDRRAAPAVDNELDVSPGDAFGRHPAIRAQRLQIRTLRRDERQRPVVEHHANDDAADHAAADADTARDAEHVALARPERRDLVERLVPAAARRSILGRHVLRQAEAERALTRPSVGAVQLDGRRQADRSPDRCATRPRTRRAGSGGWRGDVEPHQFVERWNRVDLFDGPLQALLQVFAQARRLRAEMTSAIQHAPRFGSACASSRGYIATAPDASKREKEHGEPRRPARCGASGR